MESSAAEKNLILVTIEIIANRQREQTCTARAGRALDYLTYI